MVRQFAGFVQILSIVKAKEGAEQVAKGIGNGVEALTKIKNPVEATGKVIEGTLKTKTPPLEGLILKESYYLK